MGYKFWFGDLEQYLKLWTTVSNRCNQKTHLGKFICRNCFHLKSEGTELLGCG